MFRMDAGKTGAWKDNDNDHDVAKCKVGISGHSKGEQH